MLLKQSIDWKNEWFPIDDATYLNFAVHAAIPHVALNAVRLSAEAKMRRRSRRSFVQVTKFISPAASERSTG